MFSLFPSSWRGFTKEGTRTFADQALIHLPDLYRVAFFLLGNRSAAEEMVEKVYLQSRNHGEREGHVTNLRLDLLHRLLAAAGEDLLCPPNWKDIGTADAAVNGLFRIPRILRGVVILDLIGLEVAEMAAVIGLPVAITLARQRAAWEALFQACAEQDTSGGVPPAVAIHSLRYRFTSC